MHACYPVETAHNMIGGQSMFKAVIFLWINKQNFHKYYLCNILDILSVFLSQIKNSHFFIVRNSCAELFIIKCMSSNLSVKQRFEAHSFEGLCKTGTIS